MTLETLPPEIILRVISYLPLSSLTQLHRLSRTWASFFQLHETVIYHQAALLHGMIDTESATFEDFQWRHRFSKRAINGVYSWKGLCRKRLQLRDAWNGVAPSSIAAKSLRVFDAHTPGYINVRERVHRIKVDEKRRLIISTTGLIQPSVIVRDMDTARTLWYLEPSLGRIFAHLEYENGFFIFERDTGDREVWRLVSDSEFPVPHAQRPEDFDSKSAPDAVMYQNSATALSNARLIDPDSIASILTACGPEFRPRGCFEPYALLHDKEETWASRLCYPTFLTAARERVYLWDIPSARLVEVVQDIQDAIIPANLSPHSQVFGEEEQMSDDLGDYEMDDTTEYIDEHEDEEPGTDDDIQPYSVPTNLSCLRSIRYVDHSQTHIFLAGQCILKIFARSSSSGGARPSQVERKRNSNEHDQLVFTLTSNKFRYGRWRYIIDPDSRARYEQGSDCALVRYDFDVRKEEMADAVKSGPLRLFDTFKAVHVSPCGSHFAALLCGARLLILPHFRQLIGQSEEVIYDRTLDIQLGSPSDCRSVYLAYEQGDGGEGRIGVVTTRGIFVLTFPPFATSDGHIGAAHPIKVCRLKSYMDPQRLANISCLMLSDSYLFITYRQIGPTPSPREENEWIRTFEASLRNFASGTLGVYVRRSGGFFVEEQEEERDPHSDYTVHALDLQPPNVRSDFRA